jgi:ribonuclease T2
MRWAAVAILALFATCGSVAPSGAAPASMFISSKACPAYQSIKKRTNPGNIRTEPGTAYKFVADNKTPATYHQIIVLTADPPERWVAVNCGSVTTDTPDAPAPTPVTTAPPSPAKRADYVLALSWEPAFCEGVPRAIECRRQKPTSYEATHFSLHGLWPQPRSAAYCNVSATDRAADKAHDWEALPAVDLSPATWADLKQIMPGTQSRLERHEWIEHGTCSGASEETYFSRAALFAGTINNTAIADLFARNIGRRLEGAAIRQAFDTAFGKGAGDRVRIACDQDGNRRLIGEITIGLRGDVLGTGGIGELIAAAPRTDPGCSGGIVDPAGLQ